MTNFASIIEDVKGFIARRTSSEPDFNNLARRLFELQFQSVPVYRSFCEARGVLPGKTNHWSQIPVLPVSAFKQAAITSLAPVERTTVFYSSETTHQQRSSHYHNAESLSLYETSVVEWYRVRAQAENERWRTMLFLTPPPELAPHSSLVHMFDTLRRFFGNRDSAFLGTTNESGDWDIDVPNVKGALLSAAGGAVDLMGTAFNFVHFIDALTASGERLSLPAGSRVLETGGYKGRTRALPRQALYRAMEEWLGVPDANIYSEYGMCELSSQAYDEGARKMFRFPPWARFRVVSPEGGHPVADGERGLLQVFDLANARSVLAIQTEDIAMAHGSGFELRGRAAAAEPRGCSLTSAT